MRIFIALLIACASLGAQTITNLQRAESGSNCVKIQFDLTGASSSAVKIETGSTTSLGYREVASDYTTSDSGTHYIDSCQLTAGAKNYVKVSVGATESLCPGACTNCTSSDSSIFPAGGSSLNCDAINEPPHFTTAARPGDITPGAPVHTTSDPYACFTTNDGETTATCATLESVYATQGGLTGTRLIKLDISGGACEDFDWDFPAPTTADRVCIQPDIPDSKLIPEKAQASHDDRSRMAILRTSDPKALNTFVDPPAALVDIKGGKITFRQFVFEHTDRGKPYNPTQYTITSIDDAAETVTLAGGTCPANLRAYNLGWLNLPNVTSYTSVVSIQSCASGVLTLNNFGGLTAQDITGTDATGATFTWGENIPIASCNTATPVECTTSAPHGLPTGGWVDQDFLFVNGINNVPTGYYDFVVTGASTFTLTGTTGGVAYVASDYDFARFNSGMRFAIISAPGTTGTHVLQSIIGEPWIGQHSSRVSLTTSPLSGVQSSDVILRDSILWGGHNACLVRPSDGQEFCGNHNSYDVNFWRFDGTDDGQFVNNTAIDGLGLLLNAQQPNDDADMVEDITIARNAIYASDRVLTDWVDDSISAALGHYTPVRHWIELKGGSNRIKIRGNRFHGIGVGGNSQSPQGYGIFFQATPSSKNLADVRYTRNAEVSWNMATGGAAFIGIARTAGSQYNSSYNSRIDINNNFFQGDHYGRRMSPSFLLTPAKSTGNYGAWINLGPAPTELASIKNNSIFSQTGVATSTMVFFSASFPGLLAEDNIFTYHNGALSNDGIGFFNFRPTIPVSEPSTNQGNFNQFTAPETGTYDNLIICGTEDGTAVSGKKDSSLDADTITDSECSTAFPSTGSFTGLTRITGSDYSTRHATVFPSGSPQQDGAYSTRGVSDWDLLLDEMGMTRDLVESAIGASSITISWHAPTTAACTLQYTNDDWSTISSAVAAGGSKSQSVNLSTLSGTYEGRVYCPDGKPLAWPGRTF